MKKHVKILFLLGFLVSFGTMNAQSITITNNTNCEFYWWAEGNESGTSCTQCTGGYGTIDANTTLGGFLGTGSNICTPDKIIWAAAEPVVTGGCSVTTTAEDYENGCGTDQGGVGSSCCIDSWTVTITGTNTIEIN